MLVLNGVEEAVEEARCEVAGRFFPLRGKDVYVYAFSTLLEVELLT